MIVTIDGPAGAGKSTVARGLAARLGYLFLDTGAMYRAATLAVMQNGNLEDASLRLAITKKMNLELREGCVRIDGKDATVAIRTSEVTQNIHYVADDPAVRLILVARQQAIAKNRDVVTEGRDQGTVAFPDAECKIFLTASAVERARRRQVERTAKGDTVSIDSVRAAQDLRDRKDQDRAVGALKKADDAVEVVTDGMTIEEVIANLEVLVRQKKKMHEN